MKSITTQILWIFFLKFQTSTSDNVTTMSQLKYITKMYFQGNLSCHFLFILACTYPRVQLAMLLFALGFSLKFSLCNYSTCKQFKLGFFNISLVVPTIMHDSFLLQPSASHETMLLLLLLCMKRGAWDQELFNQCLLFMLYAFQNSMLIITPT